MAGQVMEKGSMKRNLKKDDLFFHQSHGLCRLAEINHERETGNVNYVLLPVSMNRAKVRFMIPETSMNDAGFNPLMSTSDARAILDYFKTGNRKDSECTQAWDLAVSIRQESASKEPIKDKRLRPKLERSVKGLTSELAFVLHTNLKDISGKIQTNLGGTQKINPLMASLLANVDQD